MISYKNEAEPGCFEKVTFNEFIEDPLRKK
jgi:hypothetical protein